jgi:hypothetical protein
MLYRQIFFSWRKRWSISPGPGDTGGEGFGKDTNQWEKELVPQVQVVEYNEILV